MGDVLLRQVISTLANAGYDRLQITPVIKRLATGIDARRRRRGSWPRLSWRRCTA
jgi:hypothetical protein